MTMDIRFGGRQARDTHFSSMHA